MKITVDGRALQGKLTGIGTFTKNLVEPLSKYFNLSIASNKKTNYFPLISGNFFIGPQIYGSLWYHLFFPKIQEKDLLLCPLNIRPFKTKKKTLVIFHDFTPLIYPNWHNLKVRVTYIPFLEDTFLNSKIVTVSNQIKREILKFYPRAEVFVIPPTYEKYSKNLSWEKEELPEEFFLYLGTLEPRKNLIFLIEFWEENKNLPPLILAGSIGWKFNIKKFPQNIKLIGYLQEEEKIYILRKAKALIYPSLYEGFGLPIIEAQGEGTPVISPILPACEEYNLLAHIPIDLNFKSLKSGIEKILRGKIEKKETKFPPWKEVALKYKEIIENL